MQQHPPYGPTRHAPAPGPGTNALLAHLSFFLIPVLVPALFVATTPKGEFTRRVAAQALATQGLTYAFVVALAILTSIGFVVLQLSLDPRTAKDIVPFLVVVPALAMFLPWVLGLWGSIAGAMAAHRGVVWRLPLFGGLAERLFG